MQNKKAYIWGGIGKVLPQAINIFVYMILARFLSPDDFGMVGVLAILLSIANTLTDSGLGGSLIKEDTISSKDCSTVFTFNMIVSLSLYLVIFFSAQYIENYFQIDNLKPIARILPLSFILSAPCIVPKSLLIRELKFKVLTFISIISYIISGTISIIACIFGWGVYSIVCFQLLHIAITTILINFASKYRIQIGFSKDSFRRLFSFGAFTTLCNIIDSIYSNIISILLGKYVGVTVTGYYEQAKKIEATTSEALVSTINTVSFPILTRLKQDFIAFSKEADTIFAYISILILPCLGIIAIYAKEIVWLLWGEQWLDATIYLVLLMVYGSTYICESLVRNNIKSLGFVKKLTEITITKRIIGICIISVFIIISDIAILYGLIASTILGFIINIWLYCRIIKKPMFQQLAIYIKLLSIPILLCSVIYTIYSVLQTNIFIGIVINASFLLAYLFMAKLFIKSNY